MNLIKMGKQYSNYFVKDQRMQSLDSLKKTNAADLEKSLLEKMNTEEKEEKGFAFYPNYTFSVRLTNKERTTFLCLQHLSDQNQEVYHLSSLGVWKNELLSVHEWSFHSLVYCFPKSASLLLLNKLKDGTIEMEEEMLNVEMARVVRINFLIQFKLAFLSSLVQNNNICKRKLQYSDTKSIHLS